jgi:non-ribosomal peptide synthetase component F
VGICLERSIELIEATLAIVRAGAAYVPLDPDYPAERLAFMAADAGLVALVTDRRGLGALPPVECPAVLLDVPDPAGAPPPLPAVGPGGSALAYLMYTSGSTGQPKGVPVPHRAVARLVLDTDYLRLGPGDRVAQGSNPSFDAATFEIWGALLTGARLIGVPREVTLAPAALERFGASRGIGVLFLTTALFNQVVRDAPRAFAGLDAVLFGGEAVDARRVREAAGEGGPRRLLHVYGPTESTTYATWHPEAGLPAGASTVPIGQPIAATRVHVLDGSLRPVPPGVAGEL